MEIVVWSQIDTVSGTFVPWEYVIFQKDKELFRNSIRMEDLRGEVITMEEFLR